MPATLGDHVVISGYGLWLPGDERGSWSEAWDEQIGFHQPHTLHPADPVRRRLAAERMKHGPVWLDAGMMRVFADVLQRCARASDWSIAAASIEPTHTHLLLTPTRRPIDGTVRWIKDRATKHIHQQTRHDGPVWCEGRWRSYIFDPQAWCNTRDYIENHNVRRGRPPQPYAFVVNVQP
ncbi:MAG: transposase [Phycisphaeraceae bacterium]